MVTTSACQRSSVSEKLIPILLRRPLLRRIKNRPLKLPSTTAHYYLSNSRPPRRRPRTFSMSTAFGRLSGSPPLPERLMPVDHLDKPACYLQRPAWATLGPP